MSKWTKAEPEAPAPPTAEYRFALPNGNKVRLSLSDGEWWVSIITTAADRISIAPCDSPPFDEALRWAARWLRELLTIIDAKLAEDSPQVAGG